MNCTARALEALGKTQSILEAAGRRWGVHSLLNEFRGRVGAATSILTYKYGESHTVSTLLQQQQQQQQQQGSNGVAGSGWLPGLRGPFTG